ncbi:MAG: PaaI family thioesterase [Gammaproteobacteria bacterium]|nr:PaaI family thioesterase [Gammaproteobacteria bacterium]
MHHPFGELLGLHVDEQSAGNSTLSLQVSTKHLNPHAVVHGAVLYALADTGMGAALYPTLGADEMCATIEIKINYFKPVSSGWLFCHTTLVNRGKSLATLESKLLSNNVLVAQANGNFAIFRAREGLKNECVGTDGQA